MSLEDYTELAITDFKGLYDRGSDDTCPQDHAITCLNRRFSPGETNMREGSTLALTPGYASGKVRRFYFASQSTVSHLYLLDEAGNIYQDNGAGVILANGSMTDFSAFNFFDHIYFAMHDGLKGLTGQNLKILDSTGVVRDAAGPALTATNPVLGAVGAAGVVDSGVHKIAIVGETNSGHLVPPGPKISTVFTPLNYLAISYLVAASGYFKTSINGNFSTGETITIGNITYTLRTTLTTGGTVANEILITGVGFPGGTLADLSKIATTLNGDGIESIDYGIGTVFPNGKFTITTTPVFGLFFIWNDKGSAGNLVPTTDTCADFSWLNATLVNGSDGNNKISLTVIPTGPTPIVKRHIIATKAGLEEYFFVPDYLSDGTTINGLIPNNSATTQTIDFSDDELIESADYLFDLKETIPAPLGLCQYAGRLMTFGEAANRSIVRGSKVGYPESFSDIDGIMIVTKDDGYTVQNAGPLRTVFYIYKSLGVHYAIDNSGEVGTWDVIPVDAGIGVPIHGIANIVESSINRHTSEITFLADISGLVLFNGTFLKPEVTWKVRDWWKQINFNYYHKVQVVNDPENQRLYVIAPINGATECNAFLMGDYSDCSFNMGGLAQFHQLIKWSPWQFHKDVTCIGIILTSAYSGGTPVLAWGTINANVSKLFFLDPSKIIDDASAIDSYYEFTYQTVSLGWINGFRAARFRIPNGNGNLILTAAGEDNTNIVTNPTLPQLAITNAPGKDYLRLMNYNNEKMRLKLETNATTHYFTLTRAAIFGIAMWPMRPA